MNHFCKIEDIRISTRLTAEQAYDIAIRYHKANNIGGKIPDDINKAVYLDECNHITKKITWMVCSEFEENTFEGMDGFTIMVSDNDGQVCDILDHNGISISYGKSQVVRVNKGGYCQKENIQTNKVIPEYLKSTYNMIAETFPNGICEEYYWVILHLLYEYMSDRNLALVMSYFMDKPLEVIVNDIYKACQMKFASELSGKVKDRLDKCGFEEWKKAD